MADAEPLVALLEIMLRTLSNVPKVKPGGHPEDIFIDLSEEEKENLECSICFSILKEARQCINKHKFCYSCIFVWSTSGSPVNHGRCPVCRADGLYVRCPELDQKINAHLVKCPLKSCRWVGPLSLLTAHQHTTYSGTGSGAEKRGQLPELKTVSNAHVPQSSSARSIGANSDLTQSVSDSGSSTTALTPRQSVTDTSGRHASTSRISTQRQTNNGETTQRSRIRSRHRGNSTSPTRRPRVSATGLPNRLTSRQRMENGRSVATSNRQSQPNNTSQSQNENVPPDDQSSQSTTNFVPRPPTNPRPQGQAARRLPTLPNLVNQNPQGSVRNPSTDSNGNGPTPGVLNSIDNNNNVNVSMSREMPTTPETPRRVIDPSNPHRRATAAAGTGGFSNVRDRLTESRNRLDFLMNAFSVELDRGRQDLTAFQQERERRRQEQLAEVRDLGRRLGQVAQELRGLLTQRRQIRNQIDHLVESATDSD